MVAKKRKTSDFVLVNALEIPDWKNFIGIIENVTEFGIAKMVMTRKIVIKNATKIIIITKTQLKNLLRN